MQTTYLSSTPSQLYEKYRLLGKFEDYEKIKCCPGIFMYSYLEALVLIIANGVTIVESMAILQYLEDTRPEHTLLPATPLLRARMREICETIVSGIQPLQNLGLKRQFSSEQQYKEFTKYYTTRGLQTLEELLKKSSGTFCVGDQLTMADLCLVPQLYNAVTRHELKLEEFPTVSKLYDTLLRDKTISATHPEAVRRQHNL